MFEYLDKKLFFRSSNYLPMHYFLTSNKCEEKNSWIFCVKILFYLDASVSGSSPRTNDSATPLLSLKGGQDTTPLLMRGGDHGDTTPRAGGDHLIMDLEPPTKHYSRKDNVSIRKRLSYITSYYLRPKYIADLCLCVSKDLANH